MNIQQKFKFLEHLKIEMIEKLESENTSGLIFIITLKVFISQNIQYFRIKFVFWGANNNQSINFLMNFR